MWRGIHNFQFRNFYIKNGIAHTEDDVEVRKLQLNLSAAACKLRYSTLKQHFQIYGKVENLEVFSYKALGYVVYSEAQDAIKVLVLKQHFVNGCSLTVVPGNSWLQPTVTLKAEVAENWSEGLVHSLKGMMRFLTLKERLDFCHSGQIGCEIYKAASPEVSRVITMSEMSTLTEWNLIDFFKMSGKHLHRLSGSFSPNWPHSQKMAKLLVESCPNVISLQLELVCVTINILLHMCSGPGAMKSLEHLALRNCGITDNSLAFLTQLSTLKILDLSYNQELTGEFMFSLPSSLECLYLDCCTNVHPRCLAEICEALPRLREFYIQQIEARDFNEYWGDYEVDDDWQWDIYYDMVEHCLELEVLKFSACPRHDEQELANCGKLKKLIICAYELEPQPYQLAPQLLRSFAAKGPQLSSLVFLNAPPNFMDSTHFALIKDLKGLKELILPHLDGLSDDDVHKLAQLPLLEKLSLSDQNVSDVAILDLIIACPKLCSLHLVECESISDALIRGLVDYLGKAQKRSILDMFVKGTSITHGVKFDEKALRLHFN